MCGAVEGKLGRYRRWSEAGDRRWMEVGLSLGAAVVLVGDGWSCGVVSLGWHWVSNRTNCHESLERA